MRRKILYSSACLLVAGAGLLVSRGHHAADTARPREVVAATPEAPAAQPAPSIATATPLGDGLDRATVTTASSGEHFPHTAVGHALGQHLLILVDISPGADDRKARSLAELRTHAKEASQDLIDAYHGADQGDTFGRWLISLTLGELQRNEAYAGLKEIADSPVPLGLKDNDAEGAALANESAIRQNAAGGLVALARAGNAAAEADLLRLALDPPSGDDALRTLAIKGYLAAGSDYDARVQTLMTQLPGRYHDVVTLIVSQPEPGTPPEPRHTKNG